jgi:hypothetical protein
MEHVHWYEKRVFYPYAFHALFAKRRKRKESILSNFDFAFLNNLDTVSIGTGGIVATLNPYYSLAQNAKGIFGNIKRNFSVHDCALGYPTVIGIRDGFRGIGVFHFTSPFFNVIEVIANKSLAFESIVHRSMRATARVIAIWPEYCILCTIFIRSENPVIRKGVAGLSSASSRVNFCIKAHIFTLGKRKRSPLFSQKIEFNVKIILFDRI